MEGPQEGPFDDDLESTANLIRNAQNGDERARNLLAGRYYARLRAFAHGRLGPYQRDLADTDDLVQRTLVRAFQRLEAFEYRREGAFLAYLRTILMREILQEVRRATRRRSEGPPEDGHLDPGDTPSTVVEHLETFERYERALRKLDATRREAVIMWVDFGFSYKEIADALGKPSAGAAHMVVVRALARLATLMREQGIEGAGSDGA